MRESGILLPISSLPSSYGIGCFSKDAFEFIDFLKGAGQKYWQILPLGPTGYGDSPYQSFSTFAGNPYFIDLETLIADGLLTKEECDAAFTGRVNNQIKMILINIMEDEICCPIEFQHIIVIQFSITLIGTSRSYIVTIVIKISSGIRIIYYIQPTIFYTTSIICNFK